MTAEEMLIAVNAAAITPVQLTALLQKSVLLANVESKRAELMRRIAKRETAMATAEADIQRLQAELTVLQEQANQAL